MKVIRSLAEQLGGMRRSQIRLVEDRRSLRSRRLRRRACGQVNNCQSMALPWKRGDAR
jgi:hypothetical protein